MDKWLEILKLAAPIAFLTIPGAQFLLPLAPLIITAIGNVEASRRPGVEKKQIVQTHVADGIAIANQVAGKIIIDPAPALLATSVLVDAIVDSTNRIHTAAVVLPDAPLAPTA